MENNSTAVSQLLGLRINQDQKVWQFIIDANTQSPDQLDRTAIQDGTNTYTYREMLRQ